MDFILTCDHQLANMIRFVIFIITFTFINFVECDPLRHFHERNDVIYTVETANQTICLEEEAKNWSYDFHNCFIDRKYKDGGRDLNNIVDRILDHSKDCIKNSTHQCRPDHVGFMIIMDKVVEQIKQYCTMYVEAIIHDGTTTVFKNEPWETPAKENRDKIKDLDCVEKILTRNTYDNCFKDVLGKDEIALSKFQKDVDKAVKCTNRANRKCSKAAKTDLNRIVRYVLGMRQPAKEDIEDDPKPPEPPKPWYYWIVQPFVSFWRSVRSFFGF